MTLTYSDGLDVREGDIIVAEDGPRTGQRGKVLDPDSLGGLVSIRWQGEPLEHFGYLAPQALKLVRRSQAGRAK
jgi:hypothetical protein